MKLKIEEPFWPNQEKKRFTVAEAVEASLRGYHRGGATELAHERIDNIVSAFSKVVQMLHTKGVLLDAEVLELLTDFVKADDEPA